jgi:uncharacterized phage protein (TIGR01671 family)
MREIKFRVWSPKYKKFWPLALGQEFNFKETDTVLQYTGLKDRNGREIYEGDIWKRDSYAGEVVWNFSAWEFKRVGSGSSFSYPYFHSNSNTGEVIGNIYENPELSR